MSGEDFFAQTPLELEGRSEVDLDAALAGLIHLFLRGTFDTLEGCWHGRDEHDTLRRTCHAVEVIHRLNLDADSIVMTRDAGNWLINLPIRDRLSHAERNDARLYPSRFKTLAYLRRFDDDLVHRDFTDLLSKEVGGMIRGVTESDVLTTCIVLDTLLTLDGYGKRQDVCSDDRYEAITHALHQQLKQWRPAGVAAPTRRPAHASLSTTASRTRRTALLCEITNPRDLSYVLGLLLHLDRATIAPRQVAAVTVHLTRMIEQRDRARGTDIVQVLYAALQLAEHCHGDEAVQRAIEGVLHDLRVVYAAPDAARRWDFANHTLVLRLLLSHYGESTLSHNVVSRLLRDAEQRRQAERNTLETELTHVIRERIAIRVHELTELSGGFSGDQIFRVPFTYWYPTPGADADRFTAVARLQEASVIIKRSTSDAFHQATENYRQLPLGVRDLFVRQPTETQVHKSGLSSAYYLTMEDLASLETFDHRMAEWDQRAMPDHHKRLLNQASELVCDASFQLLRETRGGRANYPGTQIARLYLSPIEAKLARAVARVPWLKNPLQGYYVGEQRYKALDYYLGVIAKHANVLQPRYLGLTHGDLHARNVMLDRSCSEVKLIDLDKLSWSGDYLADLGNLLTDLCVYRRVDGHTRDFGLPREDILFVSKSVESGTAENAVRYPALGRPATVALQEQMLRSIALFAAELDDTAWKPRLWLAAATSLFVRLAFQTQKEAVAVLYGEAVRLLHDLCRHLDQGHDLAPVLVPAIWPTQTLSRGTATSELPEWLTRHEVLRRIHDGLRELGLRPEVDRATVGYFQTTDGDGPLMKFVPRGREGIGRLLLPTASLRTLAGSSLNVAQSSQPGDGLGTIVIIDDATSPSAVLRVAQAYQERRATVRTRR